MTQQLTIYGEPLAGGKLYIITAGTVSTPQDAFQDTALTIKQPYPMTLDAAGRVPQFFLDNTINSTVKIRLQDKNGVVQLASDGVLVIGPATGGGGGGGLSGDATQLFTTGDMKARYDVGSHPGWVPANGLTIGSVTSGATRANLDCQALFLHLWNKDSTLVVTPGPRTTASGDWTANKTIATPDYRGYGLTALDAMGNTAAGRMPGFTNPDTLGSTGGGTATLVVGNLPSHTHTGTTGVLDGTGLNGNPHTHKTPAPQTKQATASTVGPGPGGSLWFGVGPDADTGTQGVDHRHPFTTDPWGTTATPINTYGPRKLCTIYLKL
jgi:hypothetical protein